MKWMPIETAPRDANILAYDDGIIGEAAFINGYWWLCVTELEYGETLLKPTHWMPLPEPPQSLSASSSADER
jgi:hypothetical protein